MPAPYSQDLRWRAIFLAEILDLELEHVSFYLQISQSTIKRYVRKFREIGNVNTAIIGRPYNCISMEMVQQYPEKTNAEILDKVYEETGSQYACSTLHYYLLRNGITRKKVGKYARGQGITQYYF
jgi:transposase